MTKVVKEYPTKDLMNQDKTIFNAQGLTTLHIDFINNNQADGYRVTFVSGKDDPNNTPERIAERTKQELERTKIELLKQKAKDKDLSKDELDELLQRLAETL